MIRIFTGDDRIKIQREIKRILGNNYEIFDGENLQISDIYNICQGNSLFDETRKILIKDLTPAKKDNEEVNDNENKEDPYAVFSQFIDTKHEIVIWESNIPNRKVYKDFIKKVKVEKFQKEEFDKWASFRVFDLAYTSGKRAVAELDGLIHKVETGGEVKMLDPYLMVGAFSSSALKKFEQSPTVKNKKVLKELSKLDMQMKTSRIEPWTLIKMFLLKVEKL
ncbi:hypothetical protein IJG91_03595 [Candidatus Saccharibacteria bacterium]|nr:hypothetical protein [Candidatus Saccharibacteria bacterium]